MHGKNPENIKQYLLKWQKKKKKYIYRYIYIYIYIYIYNEQIPRTGQSPGAIRRVV